MPESATAIAPGAPAAAPAGGSSPGSVQPGAQAAPATPDAGQNFQPESEAKPGQVRGQDGRFSYPDRPLEEITEDVPARTPEERKRIRMAAKLGLTTQADLDERMGKGKAPAAPVVPGEKPVPAPAKPADVPESLAALVKAISPHLDPSRPEDAVRSLKELHTQVSTQGEEVKQLRGYYEGVQSGIIERLQRGPDGLAEMYKAFDLPVPAYLNGGAAPNGNGNGHQPPAPAAPASALAALADLADDDFATAGSVKAMVPALVSEITSQVRAALEKEYGPLKQTHEKIVGRIEEDAQAEERKQKRLGALADAQFHSEYWGGYDPEDALTDKAQKIWDDSVDEAGLKADPHPEWPKLERILKYRAQEFLNVDPKKRASTYEDHLYRRLHQSGKMSEMVAAKETRAREKLLEAQNRRIQPALAPKGAQAPAGGGLAALITAVKTGKATPEQRQEFKRRVHNREIAVSNNA